MLNDIPDHGLGTGTVLLYDQRHIDVLYSDVLPRLTTHDSDLCSNQG